MNKTENIGALVYLPEKNKIERYDAENLESFSDIDDYWMKQEGLVYFPFDRTKQAYFYNKTKGDNSAKQFEFSPNIPMTKEEYETSVFLAQQGMANEEFSKVVLARNEILNGTYDALKTFQNAVKKHPESYGYYINLGGQEWVGASPELLMHYEHGMVYSTALAGTRTLDQEFTAKEGEEQQMVEEFIEEKLIKVGLSNFVKAEKQEAIYSNIKHLKTAYTATSTEGQALELLKHLQPTSAVCGLPRDASFGFINEFETLNRSFYSGITGVLGKNSATFFVNLRCMRFYENQVELFAGAGITAESDAANEWEETEKKINTIKELL
ncbi:MAG: chorismate-binding protein [Bacteroidia bacterium]|nr:chorismate-binding protein [Bacteroidia bacterium]